MPNSRDLKTLLRPLLKRRRDLAFGQRSVFFSPLTHYVRGAVFIQRWSSADFEVRTFAAQLFDGDNALNFGSNREQYHFMVHRSWRDDREGTSVELCEQLERYSLPPVESIVGPCEHEKLPQYVDGCLPGCDPLRSPHFRFTAAVGACYFGKFDTAERLIANIGKGNPYYPAGPITEEHKYHVFFWCRAAYLLQVLRTDRARIPQLLHDWEAFTVKSLKLTKYWKPTPFPCDATS
ncbi:MAG: hypothetical protein ACHQK9_12195 [Reyranellales bacterium]